MARSFMAGMSDYSHQSLDDIKIDLHDWDTFIKDTLAKMNNCLDQLEPTEYWKQFDFDFKAVVYSVKKMFETAIHDISEVLEGIDQEIKDYHVRIIRNLGDQGAEFYRTFGKVWHSGDVRKEYGQRLFMLVENIYGNGRDMAADLIDLQNLSERLTDFVGRTGKGGIQMGPNITNNFNAPIGAVQQNYNDSTGQQNVGGERIVDVKELLIEIRDIINLLPQREQEEVKENLVELVEVMNEDKPKPNRIKAFTGAIGTSLRKVLSMKTINNALELTEKIPKILEGIDKISDQL